MSGMRAWMGAALLLGSSQAWAGGLDLFEVGGMYGTPASAGPTALWWNPAMMSDASGTSFLVEAAPVIGGVNVDRDDPLHGGLDQFRVVTAVPFAGVVTDAGVRGLGIGASVYVPYAKQGQTTTDPGTTSTHLRSARLQALHVSLGLSFTIADVVGIGLAGTYVNGTYNSVTDTAFLPDLADAFEDQLGIPCPAGECDDAKIEDRGYLVRTDLHGLVGHAGALQAGFFVRVHPKVLLSAGFFSGVRELTHAGTATLDFGCPPAEDQLLRLAATVRGLCTPEGEGAHVEGYGGNTYSYPMRVNASVRADIDERVRLEFMGGWVRWSMYRDFGIVTRDLASTNTELDAATTALLALDRKWARGNQDSFWVGVHGRFAVHQRVTVMGRVGFDRAASMPGYLSPNTVDFDTIKLMAGAEVRVSPKVPVFIGLSFNEDVYVPRVETDSLFGVTVDKANRKEDRLFFPAMNGRYSGYVHRIGISLRGAFEG